ncbi:MAG: MAPEG family [Rhodobacteraceae bacterium HLUCCO07]|nr:MAG: MAPEG family [Rhodobacteraceae bacterium HLUCCO07]
MRRHPSPSVSRCHDRLSRLRPGSTAEVDQRVLSNTIEQLVVALELWPFAALILGGFVVICMGVGFAMARLVFWTGYHVSPLVKSVGFAAGYYPTVLATLWTVVKWAT